MGIRYFVFAVNKMDLIGYDQEKFQAIEAEIAQLAGELGLEQREDHSGIRDRGR